MRIFGLRQIAMEIAKIWEIPDYPSGACGVSDWSVCGYMSRSEDPLPSFKIMQRVAVDSEELKAWGLRQVERRGQSPKVEPAKGKASAKSNGKTIANGSGNLNKRIK